MDIVLMAPVAIFEKGFSAYALEAFFILSGLILANILYGIIDPFSWPASANFLYIYLTGLIPVFFWIRKQTVIRAWFLALGGACAGPGLWLFREDKYSFISAVIVLLLVNVFFAMLTWVNYAQKKYWPNNGPCNRLRLILRQPCLNT